MRKLRLIKPWRLRTIRQRVFDVRDYDVEVVGLAPCNAPAANADEAVVCRLSSDDRSAHRRKAPVSDIIFVPRISGNIR